MLSPGLIKDPVCYIRNQRYVVYIRWTQLNIFILTGCPQHGETGLCKFSL